MKKWKLRIAFLSAMVVSANWAYAQFQLEPGCAGQACGRDHGPCSGTCWCWVGFGHPQCYNQ